MSERLNGTHEVAGKPALRDNMPMHGTANEGMERPHHQLDWMVGRAPKRRRHVSGWNCCQRRYK
ncbi:hypothetical protein WSK_0003, partial [Novosphingobium sp. Rr 2-17]|uniref:hypothetical protein n=1 Tax=Novosphingobium sp. Rr 2-17 TaxID=555793 RepID=UPI000269A474